MNDREHNVVELSGNQKLAILQPFLCLCCCFCIGSQRSYKIWTGLSGILGVTYYHEKLAGRKSLLVFCVCLCNLEHTVLLKSLYFSLVRKKKSNFSLIFESCTCLCAFLIVFETASVRAPSPSPQLPECWVADVSLAGKSQQLDFQRCFNSLEDDSVLQCAGSHHLFTTKF